MYLTIKQIIPATSEAWALFLDDDAPDGCFSEKVEAWGIAEDEHGDTFPVGLFLDTLEGLSIAENLDNLKGYTKERPGS